jgi:hypothetical protein
MMQEATPPQSSRHRWGEGSGASLTFDDVRRWGDSPGEESFNDVLWRTRAQLAPASNMTATQLMLAGRESVAEMLARPRPAKADRAAAGGSGTSLLPPPAPTPQSEAPPAPGSAAALLDQLLQRERPTAGLKHPCASPCFEPAFPLLYL